MKAIIKLCKNTYKVFINDELKADYSTLQEAQAHEASIDLNRPSVLRCKAFYQNASKWRDYDETDLYSNILVYFRRMWCDN